jgi:glycosyltransferase involved in cell wall biosynthesis
MAKLTIWFWQRMVTPHMAYLAEALAKRGHDVTYVAEENLAAERVALGWQMPDMYGVTLRFFASALEASVMVAGAPDATIHLTQGVRANGKVALAQAAIKARGQRHYALLETVDQRGVVGLLKPVLYFFCLQRWHRGLNGILAIGEETPAWLRRLVPNGLQVFPFAYFLREFPCPIPSPGGGCFRFLFVGALIPRKRLDLLLKSLSEVTSHDFEIEIVGDGPLREQLEAMAHKILPGRVSFRGVSRISEIPCVMARADCLVLPSSHDGWGAVASESLMAGTPVICSAACGSRAVVQASGAGGVFDTFDSAALRQLLELALTRGKIGRDVRQALRSWARCLGADAGAGYLETLITDGANATLVPPPPWECAG